MAEENESVNTNNDSDVHGIDAVLLLVGNFCYLWVC